MHLDTKCFTSEQIKRVFKIECFQKDPEVFEKTHYSLNLAFHDPQESETNMMEDALAESQWSPGLEERRRTGDYIRPYIIWGAPGTGKTELCRWLELNIPNLNPDCETKRITKRTLAMGGILGVAQALSNQEIDLGKKLTVRHADRGVEDMIVWALGVMMEQGKITIETGDKDQILSMFADTIRRNIEKRVKLIEEVDDISKVNTPLEFVTKQNIEREFSYYGIKLDVARVNREIYHALTIFLANVSDVKKLIFDFVKTKNNEGKIPVLIFDDVTHLGDLVDEFVSVLTDISGGKEGYICDFVIGTTTDFYLQKFKDSLASTARARTFEIRLSPEENNDLQNAKWLLGEKGLEYFLDFVLRYLDATRNCINCKNCEKSLFIEKNRIYYPFSKTFLINLYNRLLREKDEPGSRGISVWVTPRFIIQLLRFTLSKFIETAQPPSEFIDNSLVLSTLDFISETTNEKGSHQEFYRALWWYGNHSNNGHKITIEKNTLQNLGLYRQIPQRYLAKNVITYEVSPLKSTESSESSNVYPESPDEVSLKASIRRWCSGEGGQVSTNTIIDGFNVVISSMEKILSGSNNFRNIMNFRSSRVEGEVIEYSPPGIKKGYFWVGQLKDDPLQIYLMSKHKTAHLKPFVTKGFLILNLDENDFFNLYKIGNDKTSEIDRFSYLEEFLSSKRDEVFESLWNQRLRIREQLEKELCCSPEVFVLSSYILLSRLLKSKANLSEMENVEDVKKLMTYECDIGAADWPEDLGYSNEKLNSFFETVDDLFHSFFSLRGKGTVIDFVLLESIWLQIKKDLYTPIRNSERTNERFVLSKKKINLAPFVDTMKGLLFKVETYSRRYNKENLEKDINHWQELLSQLADKKALITLAQNLEGKIKSTQSFELRRFINELIIVQDIKKISLELSFLQNQIAKASDPIQRFSLLAMSNKIGKHSAIRLSSRLLNFVEKMEEEIGSTLETNTEILKEAFKEFLKLDGVF